MVYIAKPNNHLFISKGKMYLSNGPRENLFRPSIDVLFRSGAVAHKNSVVGILLTGQLNDGVAGLDAIKICGVKTMTQNPATAEFPDMPQAAIENMVVNYVVNIEDMSSVLQKIVHDNLPPEKPVPKRLERENQIATNIRSQIALEEEIGTQVPISCCSCGGPLWEIKDSKIKRYRCHVGHSFSEAALLKGQNEGLEQALWVSMRTLEEKTTLLNRMAVEYEKKGSKSLAKSYQNKRDEALVHLQHIRAVLQLND